MIVEKMWHTKKFKYGFIIWRKAWRGWFLFGIIPLYVRMIRLETFH